MKIFLDIDNTICVVDDAGGAEKYARAVPIAARIAHANKLYDQGNHITYWTARGKASGVDYSDLTRRQLQEWGCKYHELRFDKPSYDLYVDDKSQNTLAYFDGCECCGGERVSKGWGHELIIVNNEKYCGKILHLNTGARFSMHYHIKKMETWYVYSGQFEFRWIDTSTAEIKSKPLNVGDIVTNEVGVPHQLVCLKEGDIFEVSTQHFDSDSYRVFKGDSQTGAGGANAAGSAAPKHQKVVMLMHMGLGDHIIMTPAVREIAKQTAKLYIPCKSIYLDTLKTVYGEFSNVDLIPITSTTDERVLGGELQRVLNELHVRGEPLAIAASGMYAQQPNPIYPFPSGFYKDLGLDFISCVRTFKWGSRDSAFAPLLQILKQLNIPHIFVHDTSSTQTGAQIADNARAAAAGARKHILLNPDKNMYEASDPYYYLAQLAVRTAAHNILDYIPIIESAAALFMIDSCYFCMSAFTDLSRVNVKTVYKRSDVGFEWVSAAGWRQVLL